MIVYICKHKFCFLTKVLCERISIAHYMQQGETVPEFDRVSWTERYHFGLRMTSEVEASVTRAWRWWCWCAW